MGEHAVRAYAFRVDIQAEADRVWTALLRETNHWWTPDFRMVAPDSLVAWEAEAGGKLTESHPTLGGLLWYTVQWIQPHERTLYMVGYIDQDWGGPTTSHQKITIEPQADGTSLLHLRDSLHGRVNDASVDSLQSGWTALYTDGLKKYVESPGDP